MSNNSDEEKKSLFFRDEGELGDVLSKAREIKEKSVKLAAEVKDVEEKTQEYADLVEEAKFNISIKERLGEKIGDFKDKISNLRQNWQDKKQVELKDKVNNITSEKADLENQLNELESKLQEAEGEEKKNLEEELSKIKDNYQEVNTSLENLETTKDSIEEVISKSDEEIRDEILSKQQNDLMRVSYYNLIKSRLDSIDIVNPLTDDSYPPDSWDVKSENDVMRAVIKEGLISKKSVVSFEFDYLSPTEKEGFVYKKIGNEAADKIVSFLEKEKDKESFSSHVLVSGTGWHDSMISYVDNINDRNCSVFLIDLMNKGIHYNQNDKKTKNFVEWFTPVPFQEEVDDLIGKLKEEIEERTIQFRADKVADKYGIQRKVVISAFNDMVDEKLGEIIDEKDGAKDLIFLAGGN